MVLYPVKILKHDSCYTYALKRTGICSLKNLSKSAESFILEQDLKDISDIKRGDILYFSRPVTNKNTVTVGGSITANREIIQESICYNLHFSVYEGEGLVSELIRVNDSYVFEINLVRLNDIKHFDWKVIKHPLNT